MFRARLLCAALCAAIPAAAVHAQVMPKAADKAADKPAGAAAAKTPPPARPARPSPFDEMDTNHDGFISREEYLASQKKRFEEFDTNHDGKIDAKEIASSPVLMKRNMDMAQRMIQQWDSNGDGIVTAEEFKKFSNDRFTKQDKSGTGKIARPTSPPPMMNPNMMHPPGGPNAQKPMQLKVNPAPGSQPAPPQPQH